MNLNPESESELWSMQTEELWELFKTIYYEEKKLLTKVMDKIKNGINLDFDIRYVINGYVKEDIKNKKAEFRSIGMFDLKDYWDEMDERTALMRTIAFRHIKDEDLIAGPDDYVYQQDDNDDDDDNNQETD